MSGGLLGIGLVQQSWLCQTGLWIVVSQYDMPGPLQDWFELVRVVDYVSVLQSNFVIIYRGTPNMCSQKECITHCISPLA